MRSAPLITARAAFRTCCHAMLLVLLTTTTSLGFQLQQSCMRRTTRLRDAASENPDILRVKEFLQENYPAMSALLQANDGVWKALGGSDEGFTVFAVNDAAFASLSEKRREQLSDVRNAEGAERIGAYHVIDEVVTADELFEAGGIITIGGEVPVGRSVTGGLFGLGGKEDGGVTINGAKIVDSIVVGNGIFHEVDGFISPNLLWRYMDQLRIPGSS